MELLARNVNSVWPVAVRTLRDGGHLRDSRCGRVIEYYQPVMSVYENPKERVLFDPLRDANPFFHVFEGLWILAGLDDVEWPSQFNKRLASYSDDGVTFHGAYGKRLRKTSVGDQLLYAVRQLDDNPDDRRVVLTLWEAEKDLGRPSKDIPCNTHLYVKVREEHLIVTVCNRSNDIIWGLYGANAVQWSMIQEYIAAHLRLPVGPLTTLSDSFHAYTENDTWKLFMNGGVTICDPYEAGLVAPWPLIDDPRCFDAEVQRFIKDPLDRLGPMFPNRPPCRNSFIWKVAQPLYKAWVAHRENKHGYETLQKDTTDETRKIDWIAAALAWLERREAHDHRTIPAAHRARQARRDWTGGRATQVRGQLAKKRGR